MSRLDSFIRRMCAQRDLLNAMPALLIDRPGMVLEFGLGSGRTFDHLRKLFPQRRIVVFERDLREAFLPEPPPEELVIGDIRDTIAAFPDGCAALLHADINTGTATDDAALVAWLAPLASRLLAPGGMVVSSIALPHPRLQALPLPATVPDGRYFLARRLPVEPG